MPTEVPKMTHLPVFLWSLDRILVWILPSMEGPSLESGTSSLLGAFKLLERPGHLKSDYNLLE